MPQRAAATPHGSGPGNGLEEVKEVIRKTGIVNQGQQIKTKLTNTISQGQSDCWQIINV